MWDESFHALVSKNLLKHPLMPTLIDRPAFQRGEAPFSVDWAGSSVWFHKGTLPLWLGAAGMAITGPGPLGIRAASLMLSLGSVVLLFLLGNRLFNLRVGTIAAALLAVNPYFTGQIHGIMFTDIIDCSLLFFVLGGLLSLAILEETGKRAAAAAAGAATALAFMSKYYLGLAVPVVAVLLVMTDSEARRTMLKPAPVIAFAGAMLAILGPWFTYNLIKFPTEFSSDVLYYFGHLTRNTEGWGGPWDRFLFEYVPSAARDAFVPGFLCLLTFGTLAVSQKKRMRFVVLWLLTAAIPHLAASTKVPSYGTLTGASLVLLMAILADEALRFNPVALALASGTSIAAMICRPQFPGILAWRRGMPPGNQFFAIGASQTWIWNQLAITAAVAAVAGLVFFVARESAAGEWVKKGFKAVCVAGLAVILARELNDSRTVTGYHPSAANLLEVAHFAETTDPASVFFVDPRAERHTSFMFYADRAAYAALRPQAEAGVARISPERPVYFLSPTSDPSAVFTARSGQGIYRLR